MSYEIIAIIIGPLVAVFTVYLEYKKDLRIKLDDRKQFWLKKHYISIQENINRVANSMQIKNNMIYNGAVQISIQPASRQGMYQMIIISNIDILCKGDINEHLKSYPFYNELMDLNESVEEYKINLNSLYFEFLRFAEITVGKYFNGTVKPIADLLYTVETYNIKQMFNAVFYSVVATSKPTITENPSNIFVLEYEQYGSYVTVYTSSSKANAEMFANSVMPDIISYFTGPTKKLVPLVQQSTEIGDALENIVPKISKITGDYNSGIPIRGECENCRSIKNIKKLDELMPPN